LAESAILLFQPCSRIAILYRDFITTVLPQKCQSKGRSVERSAAPAAETSTRRRGIGFQRPDHSISLSRKRQLALDRRQLAATPPKSR
jgi:hypothetical protein